MPPAVRAKYGEAMQALDRDHDGVPDILQGAAAPSVSLPSTPAASAPFTLLEAGSALLQPVAPSQPVIAPDGSGSRVLLTIAGVVIIILLLVVLGLLVYVFQH